MDLEFLSKQLPALTKRQRDIITRLAGPDTTRAAVEHLRSRTAAHDPVEQQLRAYKHGIIPAEAEVEAPRAPLESRIRAAELSRAALGERRCKLGTLSNAS